MTEEQVFEVLQWLLANGIIDHTTFNKLLLESLPFAE